MENKINIAELLKDCPKGTKLYSPMCGECMLERVTDRVIDVFYSTDMSQHNFLKFFPNGAYIEMGECLLFPSKDNRDWRAFKAPKKEQPKFKVGDVVKDNKGHLYCLVKEIKHPLDKYNKQKKCFQTAELRLECRLSTTNTFATPEEIAKWNEEVLQPNHLHYSKSKRKIIDWLLPFDRVIVKNFEDGAKYNIPPFACWCAQIFSHYVKGDKQFPYHCMNDAWSVCLPYNEKTAKLIGTTDDWE